MPLHPSERRRRVAGPGSDLAVFEYGPEPAPGVSEVALVHGYPDDHTMWGPLIRELAADHHVIAYDTRNAGDSLTAGTDLAAFRLPLLVEDLYAVLDAAAAGAVHLVGHDWGSIQGWAAARDPRATTTLAGYTSISGPDLLHFRRWIAERARNPRRWPVLARQALRSTYVGVFQIPRLPELLFTVAGSRLYERATGRPVRRNPQRGLALYRANFSGNGGDAVRDAPVQVPVHVVVPLHDPFLSPALNQGVQRFAPAARFTAVDAGHWFPATHAARLGEMVRGGVPPTKAGGNAPRTEAVGTITGHSPDPKEKAQ